MKSALRLPTAVLRLVFFLLALALPAGAAVSINGADIRDGTISAAKIADSAASAFTKTLLDNADATAWRADLGLVIGTNVQAYDADLTAFAAKTAPAGAVVGTTDTQTLTNKTLTSPAITTPTGIVKGDVGLGNVDNTSDAAKPVSTATQTALDAKQPLDSDLTAFALKTAPAGAVVGTTDTQTLTNKSIDAGQLTGTVASARLAAATPTAAGAILGDYALTPSKVGSYTWNAASTIIAQMAVDDEAKILYTADFTADRVTAHDITNPAAPTVIGYVSVSSQPRCVLIYGNYLFVICAGGTRLQVIDRTNPAAMSSIQSVLLGGQGKQGIVVGDHLYLARLGALEKWRITTTETSCSVTLVASITNPAGGQAYNVSYSGGYFAVVGGSTTLSIVSEASFTKTDYTINGSSHGWAAWYGRYLLISNRDASNILVYDCRNIASPVALTTIPTHTNPEQIFIVGPRAYVPSLTESGSNNGYLECIDLTNIASPVVGTGLALQRGTAFVAPYRNYLFVSTHYAAGVNMEICKLETPVENSAPRPAASPVLTAPLSAYAAGSAYTLTASAALADFGTTDPTITFAASGTYLLMGRAMLQYNAATYAANQTATVKLRRTNNTVADITSATTTTTLRILTTTTDAVGALPLPPVLYTATAGDVVSVYASVSATPSAGSVDCTEASIVAMRLY